MSILWSFSPRQPSDWHNQPRATSSLLLLSRVFVQLAESLLQGRNHLQNRQGYRSGRNSPCGHNRRRRIGALPEDKNRYCKTPFLNWSWKVMNTFPGIDETMKSGDDFSARIYGDRTRPSEPGRCAQLCLGQPASLRQRMAEPIHLPGSTDGERQRPAGARLVGSPQAESSRRFKERSWRRYHDDRCRRHHDRC